MLWLKRCNQIVTICCVIYGQSPTQCAQVKCNSKKIYHWKFPQNLLVYIIPSTEKPKIFKSTTESATRNFFWSFSWNTLVLPYYWGWHFALWCLYPWSYGNFVQNKKKFILSKWLKLGTVHLSSLIGCKDMAQKLQRPFVQVLPHTNLPLKIIWLLQYFSHYKKNLNDKKYVIYCSLQFIFFQKQKKRMHNMRIYHVKFLIFLWQFCTK